MTEPETKTERNMTARDVFLIAVVVTERAETALQDARWRAELGLPSNLDHALRFKAAADALWDLCCANLLSGTETEP